MRQQRFQQKKSRAPIIAAVLAAILIVCGALGVIWIKTAYAPQQQAAVENKDLTKAMQAMSDALENNIEKVTSAAAGVPESLQQLYRRNQETLEFVLGYKEAMQNPAEPKLTKEEIESDAPHFLQWDKRWGYTDYCNGYFAVTACGPTCLSMVIVGLTHNANATPRVLADYSQRNGYSIPGTGTAWALMTAGAKTYGIKAKELSLNESVMITELDLGHPIICALSPGDFTQVGHFIVIHEYRDGKFWVHDPNSPLRSSVGWDYETLQPQILNLWSFSAK